MLGLPLLFGAGASDELLKAIVALAIGAAGGSGGTLVALRTWRYQVNRDLDECRTNHLALERKIDGKLDLVDRRQMLQLKLLADVARKVGVSGRFDDLVVQLLASENDAPS